MNARGGLYLCESVFSGLVWCIFIRFEFVCILYTPMPCVAEKKLAEKNALMNNYDVIQWYVSVFKAEDVLV